MVSSQKVIKKSDFHWGPSFEILFLSISMKLLSTEEIFPSNNWCIIQVLLSLFHSPDTHNDIKKRNE